MQSLVRRVIYGGRICLPMTKPLTRLSSARVFILNKRFRNDSTQASERSVHDSAFDSWRLGVAERTGKTAGLRRAAPRQPRIKIGNRIVERLRTLVRVPGRLISFVIQKL
jgi:hypothetical protein